MQTSCSNGDVMPKPKPLRYIPSNWLPPSSTEIFLPPTPQPEMLTPETASEPTPSGTIEIRLGRAMVVIDGTVDTNVLRMILETLRV